MQTVKSGKAKSSSSVRVARLLLLIILMPIALGVAYKIYRTPPKFLNMTIHVDMFHDDFYVPHKYLDDWSLVVKKRYSRHMGKLSVTHHVAYMELSIPMDEIIPEAQGENFKVKVVTKASSQDVEEGNRIIVKDTPEDNDAKEEYLQRRLREYYYGSETTKYNPVFDVENDWHVYRGNPPPKKRSTAYVNDLYAQRNEDGSIKYLLSCVSRDYYLKEMEKKFRGETKYKRQECPFGAKCEELKRTCRPQYGIIDTEKYRFSYHTDIDKKYLNDFDMIVTNVVGLIETFSVQE